MDVGEGREIYLYNGDEWFIIAVFGTLALAIRVVESGGDACSPYVIPYEAP